METTIAIIVGIVATIASLFGLFFVGKKSGAAQVEKKVAVEKANEAIERSEQTAIVTEKVKHVQETINSKSDDDAISELRDKWSRD